MAPHALKDMPQLRPAEIKTYHSETYDRISPKQTKFDAKGKTLFITAGGKDSTSVLIPCPSPLTLLQPLA
jgi:hypothetical protein